MARMIVADHEYVTTRYKLHKLKELEELVADAVQVCQNGKQVEQASRMTLKVCQVNLPFNNPITGFCVRNYQPLVRVHRQRLTFAFRLSPIKLAFMRRPYSRVGSSPTPNITEG